MATNPSLLPENAGRLTAPDADYPYGSAKNDSTGTTGDGTPIRAPLLNDTYGFYQWLLTQAGIVPSGVADTALVSQLGQALQAVIAASGTGLPSGYFSGFTMANDGGAPNTTISVGAGSARDSTNTNNIELASALRGILQSSGAWAAGDNQNKLDTGAKAINTWYHVFAIRKTSDGTGDIIFSLSATSPTMPSGYAGFRRVSSIRTDASGNILGFINEGDFFRWKVPTVDLTSAAIATLTDYVMKVPTGARVVGKFGVQGNGGDYSYYFCEPDSGDLPSPMYYGVLTGNGDDRSGQDHFVITNTSAQVRIKTGVSTAQINVSALGWQELRG